ncbi:MAG: hypothetical protein JHC31_10845 [Sulfurihydrogenibium sp.]|nr:hypothetical protein [Sulfurihydrogenibium sp.]
MNKKDLLSKLAQIYEEHEENTRPILFPSDIPRQDVESIAREIVSTIESYDVNIDKRELEKLSKEIAEGYLFEFEVDRLINKIFEEIKEKENLDKSITLDKFIENEESDEIFEKYFEKYLNKTKEKWERNLEKELEDPEKAGTFIVFQAQETIGLMRSNIGFLKDPLKIEKEAINLVKSEKSLHEFLLLLFKMKKEKGQLTNIQQEILIEKDFIGFTLSTLKEIDSKVKIEENEFDEVKQYVDTLKHETITIFKNTKHLSQETIENIERLKQDLIKDTSELDTNITLKDAIKHVIKLEASIKADIELLKQEIKRREEFINNINKKTKEENNETIDNMSLKEFSEEIKKISQEAHDRGNTIYNPIEMVNLFRTAHRKEKLKKLNKYITYHWIYKLKRLEITKLKLIEVSIEFAEKELIELEKCKKNK